MAKKRKPRIFTVSFWAPKRLLLAREVIEAMSGVEAREKTLDKRPTAAVRTTVSVQAKFGRFNTAARGFTEWARTAETGDQCWREGDGHKERDMALKAGVKIETTMFYAVNATQVRDGDDRSACERVRISRITVLGKMKLQNDDQPAQGE